MSSDPYACPNIPQLIGVLEGGDFNAELADDYRDLIAKMENAAAETSGKTKIKGKIVLTIDLSLQGGAYEATAACKVTEPKRQPRRTVLYATAGNTLSRNDPKQNDMFLRGVDKPGETRAV